MLLFDLERQFREKQKGKRRKSFMSFETQLDRIDFEAYAVLNKCNCSRKSFSFQEYFVHLKDKKKKCYEQNLFECPLLNCLKHIKLSEAREHFQNCNTSQNLCLTCKLVLPSHNFNQHSCFIRLYRKQSYNFKTGFLCQKIPKSEQYENEHFIRVRLSGHD